jgi:hypothetical protein
MECKGKIICNEKEVATIDCTEGGITIKCTDEGKSLCADFAKGCC